MVDAAMQPAKVFVNPSAERFQDYYRRWQGVASIEVTSREKIFVVFFSGQIAEAGGNNVILCSSVDGGRTFESAVTAVEHPDLECRVYNPNIWLDPQGRLWLIWNQSRGFDDGRCGVWVSLCENPDSDDLTWSRPRRVANGMMLNKPIVASNGEWFFPAYIRNDETSGVHREEDHGIDEEKFSNVYVSADEGQTFELRGGADVPERQADEHMVVELKDKTLWMLVRTLYGIGESTSEDFGRTWSPGKDSGIPGPCSRFYIGRLKSGRLLMINHHNFTGTVERNDIIAQKNVKSWKGRNNLTALLSEDEGKTGSSQLGV